MGACGQTSLIMCSVRSTYCVSQTEDEKAMLALNDGDYALAQQILEALIAKYPLEYFRYPRLAATYASEAGFLLTNIVDLNTSASSSLFDQVRAFLPTPNAQDLGAFQGQLKKMGQARSLLLLMPKIQRMQGTSFYGASAEFQLVLYQFAYSIMFLNQFAVMTSSGKLDPKILATMTVADAVLIFTNLAQAAQYAGLENPSFGQAVAEVTTQIQAKDGADDRAKMIQFLQTQNE